LLATSKFPSSIDLINVQKEYSWQKSDDPNMDRGPLIIKGINEVEEHNIKLVYVMQALWNRFGHWYGFYEAAKSFTLTPNIGPKNSSFMSNPEDKKLSMIRLHILMHLFLCGYI
jgi:hypothetical protein